MLEWVSHLHPILQAIIRIVLFFAPLFMALPVVIWYERRLLAWFQDRFGPNRTGTITFSRTSHLVPGFLRGHKISLWGLPQILADGVKSFFKEDFAPGMVDRLLYFAAPAVFLFPAFMLGGTIPWGPFHVLTPISDIDIGILYILAVSSLGVYGVVLAGYSSNNKYSLLGGLRSSAQLISYELGMGMALAAVVMAAGTLRPTGIVAAQEGPLWGFFPALANWNIFTPYGFVAGIIFLICMIAETNRAPFDLPEAESELVAGYNTEYSTKKWVLFMMGEYVGMLVYGGIFATVFLGGYHLAPFPFAWLAEHYPSTSGLWNTLDYLNGNSWLGIVWFWLKVAVAITGYIWIRATLPRLRYDQLMSLGWKSLLPLAVANLIVVAMWILIDRLYGPVWALGTVVLAAAILIALYKSIHKLNEPEEKKSDERRTVVMNDLPAQKPVLPVEETVPATL
ncbi:NADH dehydrogenase subunit H [Fimbriimonas ginsengisoli Gsoil 348]|uniref:NADH-quinone oxidoreductase subunit H n=1 Tax=Fimbriimonas ginsengisoli Gsoil 348 TaxID=661478 RepID=A0A068NKK5_FIMGI|nr:NADH dehydrogenase subunit H [Fimbriimonas ginsengisoli Gsoil 348]